MKWIKLQDDQISAQMPVLAYGRAEDDSSEPYRVRVAEYDDGDYECCEKAEKLDIAFLYEFLSPDTKWITDEEEMKKIDKDGRKFIVWCYQYQEGKPVDRNKRRSYCVATVKDYKFYDSDGDRLWVFAVAEIPPLPQSYATIINEYDNIEQYYTVKLKGDRTMVETTSGRKSCVKYDGKFYNVDEPVRLKSKSLCVSYVE